MAISIKTLAQVGTVLKREGIRQERPVDDKFLVELYTYAHNPFLQDLDESDMRVVLQEIGRDALEKQGSLDIQAIGTTIRRICHPKGAWDSCHNAARTILIQKGRLDAAAKIASKTDELFSALNKAGFK